MTMRSFIIDKETKLAALIVCRKSMDGIIISDGKHYLCLLDVFLEDIEQQVHKPLGAVLFLHTWLLSLHNSTVLFYFYYWFL